MFCCHYVAFCGWLNLFLCFHTHSWRYLLMLTCQCNYFKLQKVAAKQESALAQGNRLNDYSETRGKPVNNDQCIQQFLILCQWCTVFLSELLWLHYMTHKTVLYLTWDWTDILYGFSKQEASIWSLSLQILNYIYWNMTYCALSLYLNCILCCYPFSCLVNTCIDCAFKNK